MLPHRRTELDDRAERIMVAATSPQILHADDIPFYVAENVVDAATKAPTVDMGEMGLQLPKRCRATSSIKVAHKHNSIARLAVLCGDLKDLACRAQWSPCSASSYRQGPVMI